MIIKLKAQLPLIITVTAATRSYGESIGGSTIIPKDIWLNTKNCWTEEDF